MVRFLCCIRTQASSPSPFNDDEKSKLDIPIPLHRPVSRQSRPISEFSEAAREIRRIFQTTRHEDPADGKIPTLKIQEWTQSDGTSSFSPQPGSRCSVSGSRSHPGSRDTQNRSVADGDGAQKALPRLYLSTPVSKPCEHLSGQRAQPGPGNLEMDEASQMWERALLAHAFELASGRPSPARSELGRRSVSPGVIAVRSRKDIRARSSLAMPNFSALRSRSKGSGARGNSPLEHSPTLKADDEKTDVVHWIPTFRRKRSFPSWSRFPSDSREIRTGAAGASDGIATKDFAFVAPRLLADSEMRARKTASKFKVFNTWCKPRSWMSGWHIRKSDWRRYEKGIRSSIAPGGVLSHPELEMLPQMTTPFTTDTNLFSQQREANTQQSVTQRLLSDYTFGIISQSKQDLYEKGSPVLSREQEDDISPFERMPQTYGPMERAPYTLHPNDALMRKRSPAPSRASSTSSFQSAIYALTGNMMDPSETASRDQQSVLTSPEILMATKDSHVDKKPSTATFRTAEQSFKPASDDDIVDLK